jgi:hypothetical protein
MGFFWHKEEGVLFTASSAAVGLIQPSFQLLGVKWLEYATDSLTPSVARVKCG